MSGAPGFPIGFWPVLDGEILSTHVFDPQAAPTSLDVPLLIGQTGTEFTLFLLADPAAYALDDESNHGGGAIAPIRAIDSRGASVTK